MVSTRFAAATVGRYRVGAAAPRFAGRSVKALKGAFADRPIVSVPNVPPTPVPTGDPAVLRAVADEIAARRPDIVKLADVKRCECGCGEPAPLATRSNARTGQRNGEPRRFIAGHNTRVRPVVETCSVDACNQPHRARGLCTPHYYRLMRSPDRPPLLRPARPDPDPDRFDVLYKLDRLGMLFARRAFAENGCWEWTGALNNQGYGQIRVAAQLLLTHRFAYEQLVGPIPSGLQLDHLCRNRRCFNPEHLEPVTQEENMRRGRSARHESVPS